TRWRRSGERGQPVTAPDFVGLGLAPSAAADGVPRRGRVRRALRGCARAVLGWTARPARLLPGLAAVGCAVAGAWLLWGLGWALLAAVPFRLPLDARTPRGGSVALVP